MDRYEEALEKARTEYEKAREQGYTWLINLLEGMFPELKESEDERIRKELIGHCKDLVRMNKDDKVMLSVYEPWLVWLEKQKENPNRLTLIGKAKSEKQVVLLAESNGDENIYWDTKSEEDAVSLLEKGLKFFGKQKPAEWSEEDEDMYARIVRRYTDYEGVIMRIKEESVADKMLDAMAQEETWLKSLRHKPHWKPSEGQMTMLLAVINNPNNAGAESCHLMLQSLYVDLQKLL